MDTAQTKIIGIDISHYQHQVDWVQVKASGNQFAFIKASEGTSIDPLYRLHVEAARREGIIVGSYHFFHPKADPVIQARTMIDATQGCFIGDLPHVLDVELADGLKVLGAQAADNVLKFLQFVESATGMTPIIYTAASFFLGEQNPSAFARYPLWVANYGVSTPKLPAPWKDWKFWQYSEHQPVAGVGKIDADFFNGSLADLQAMTKK